MKVTKTDDGSLDKGNSQSFALSPGLRFPPQIQARQSDKMLGSTVQACLVRELSADEVNSSNPTETIKDEFSFYLWEPIRLKAPGS